MVYETWITQDKTRIYARGLWLHVVVYFILLLFCFLMKRNSLLYIHFNNAVDQTLLICLQLTWDIGFVCKLLFPQWNLYGSPAGLNLQTNSCPPSQSAKENNLTNPWLDAFFLLFLVFYQWELDHLVIKAIPWAGKSCLN